MSLIQQEQSNHHPRSRRALLAGALGGLAAWAASTAARVNPAEAAAGDPIRMGHLNTAGGTSTTLRTDDSQPAFRAIQLGDGSALRGEARGGRGVVGMAAHDGGIGVWGSSPGGAGGVGVYGHADTNIAIYGRNVEGTGVYGQSSEGAGVIGDSPNSTGVFAVSTTAIGLHGQSQTNRGVYGFSNSGTGVYGQTNSGYAGFFNGPFGISTYQDISRSSDPPASQVAGTARLFVRDNGSGKSQLCVRFNSGAVQVLATEP